MHTSRLSSNINPLSDIHTIKCRRLQEALVLLPSHLTAILKPRMQDYESERNHFQGTRGHKNLISPASKTQFKCRNTRASEEKAFLGHRRSQNLKPLMIPARSEHTVAMSRLTTLYAYRGDDLLKITRKNQGD
jgi:hypothetical protein